MCNTSADAIDNEILSELSKGAKVEPTDRYDTVVNTIVEKAKEIRLGANHKETLVVTDMPIRLYIRGDRLSINEWNSLFSRYENDPNSKIIDHLDDSEHDRDYAVIETTLYTVLSKGALMDLKFLSSIKDGYEW